jgi:hypothetical protein
MKELKDYFVSHSQAESLKELGFKDECLAWYRENGDFNTNLAYRNISTGAPLIAQAYDWLYAEIGTLSSSIDDGIEKLRLLKKKIQFTINLTFEVYQADKTYEDGEYLIIKEDDNYPISVIIAYGQICMNNGISFDDEDIAYISPSFEVFR